MLRINRRTDYAIRVMLALAKHSNQGRLSARQIETQMLVPRPFLNRIIANLSKKNLIRTYPGPNGGLELTHPLAAINLRQVYEAIEGPLLLSDCLEAPGACPLDLGCPVHRHWCRLQAMLTHELELITLDQLAAEAQHLNGSIT